MKRVLFIQNGEYDAPGLLATVAQEQGIDFQVVHAWQGEPVPRLPEAWEGIAVGGGAMSAYEHEQHPWLRDLTELLRGARSVGVPTLGMCLGAQLQAQAWGGEVYRNTEREIGFHEVRFTPAAAQDPLWREQSASPIRPVSWHQDTFTLPSEAVLLASSELTPNQLFRLEDRHYGLQFHLEMDGPVFSEMVALDAAWLAEHGVDPEHFLETSYTALPRVEALARTVFSRWLKLELPR